jgi:S-adenosylmethionine synthetase
MIRICEMVLPGHPDKFCDDVADAIVAECLRVDPYAYCQVEVGVWSDQVWLSGGTFTQTPLPRPLAELVVEVGLATGYRPGNHIDATRYKVSDTVCQLVGDPTRWTHHVNDQSIVIGWAGYDERTRWMPPEHFLAQALRRGLYESCRYGLLHGCGPDGKLMVRLREEGARWTVEHLLVSLQQPREAEFTAVCEQVAAALRSVYEHCRRDDRRWLADWDAIELLLNPNGPFIEGGSDGDNGQTGRKLVMDFYGPRVPIGGGALAGKHPTHIDRIAAFAARDAAVHAVRTGAQDCLVRLAYGPNVAGPLDIAYEMTGRGHRMHASFFDHGSMRKRYHACLSPIHALRGDGLDSWLPESDPA